MNNQLIKYIAACMQPSSEFHQYYSIYILWNHFMDCICFFLISLYFVAVFHNLLFFCLVAELTNDDFFKTEVGFCVELRMTRLSVSAEY